MNEMRIGQREKGQSMVELALILPFLLLLLVATVEAGFALRDYLMVQSANREGVRWAVRTPPTHGGEDALDHFRDEKMPEVFDRILDAAEEGGLRQDDIGIIVTHVYLVDSDGDGDYDEATYRLHLYPPTFSPLSTKLDAQAIADDNAAKAAQINALREGGDYEALDRELVIVEVFYRHETLWGMDIVGPFGADWTMYANSSMRMVGTGR